MGVWDLIWVVAAWEVAVAAAVDAEAKETGEAKVDVTNTRAEIKAAGVATSGEAKAADGGERKGWLHGIPIAIKDLENAKGPTHKMGTLLWR